jgi:two-component system, NarL family, sensor histidine kinase UhpB
MSTTLPFRPEAGCEADTDLLRAAFEKCPQGIAIVQNAHIHRSNRAFASLFGYSVARELEGRPLSDLLPISHPCAATLRTPGDAFVDCGYPSCQFEGRRNDGSHNRMESSCVPLEIDGETYLLLLARDISTQERRRVVRDSEKRYRAIFDAAAIGIVQCTMDGRVVESNPAVERMLGYTRAELRGMHFRDFTHPEDVQADLELFGEIVSGKRDHYEVEIRSLRKDRSYGWVRLTVSLVRGPAGEPEFTIGIVEDITERKLAEAQLREAQKMEAVGRVVGGVAHDFNIC